MESWKRQARRVPESSLTPLDHMFHYGAGRKWPIAIPWCACERKRWLSIYQGLQTENTHGLIHPFFIHSINILRQSRE